MIDKEDPRGKRHHEAGRKRSAAQTDPSRAKASDGEHSASTRKQRPRSNRDGVPTRGSRTREATRQKLINAALNVIAKKGVDSTAIADITETADVGFGSFYNHFTSKIEIIRVVFELRANELGVIADHIGNTEKDIALAIAYIQRSFLTKTLDDPVWGWFIVHATEGLPEMSRVFMLRGKADIARGLREGRLTVSCIDTAMRIILASLLSTMRALLEKQIPPSAVGETIYCLLRMLGVEAGDAEIFSKKELPKYVVRLFTDRATL